jgi:hypothetical protein
MNYPAHLGYCNWQNKMLHDSLEFIPYAHPYKYRVLVAFINGH